MALRRFELSITFTQDSPKNDVRVSKLRLNEPTRTLNTNSKDDNLKSIEISVVGLRATQSHELHTSMSWLPAQNALEVSLPLLRWTE